MTDPMTPEELKACRERAEAATPGPWEMSRRDDVMGGFDYFVEAGPLCVAVAAEDARPTRGMGAKRDAAFIAHARQDVPRMLATIDKLREDAAADEWQPIEIAPEDEGLVQVWDSFENLPVVARFDGMHWISEETGRELAPTHYRRLPKSPFAPNGAGQ